jgi:hypothetical protein
VIPRSESPERDPMDILDILLGIVVIIAVVKIQTRATALVKICTTVMGHNTSINTIRGCYWTACWKATSASINTINPRNL